MSKMSRRNAEANSGTDRDVVGLEKGENKIQTREDPTPTTTGDGNDYIIIV